MNHLKEYGEFVRPLYSKWFISPEIKPEFKLLSDFKLNYEHIEFKVWQFKKPKGISFVVFTAIAALLLSLVGSVPVEAADYAVSDLQNTLNIQPAVITQNVKLNFKPVPELKPVKPVEHIVTSNDTLTSIARENNTTIQRLYDKNPQIKDPDLIIDGDKIIVPTPLEALQERPIPIKAVEPISEQKEPESTPVAYQSDSLNINLYEPGQCTYYAKSKRPDLPNTLGNADTWAARAAALGIPTGAEPRAGAIGQAIGAKHVVYIEAVNPDGTVYLSEMNYDFNGGFRYRTAPASDFTYIY